MSYKSKISRRGFLAQAGTVATAVGASDFAVGVTAARAAESTAQATAKGS
ncbi:MAG: hypothetical protein ACI81R_003244, partial [Bradymonadia bacterium]